MAHVAAFDEPPMHAPQASTIPTEKELDAALKDTFPASDPVSATAHLTATPTSDSLGAAEHSVEHPGVVTVYRVVDASRKDKPFGSAPSPAGRWTSEGTPAVYASLSPAAALLEFLAHCEGTPPESAFLAKAHLPRGRVTVVHAYPSRWRERPYRADVQRVGDAWSCEHRSLAAQVPSALSEESCNILINPEHVDAPLIQGVHVTRIDIDERLRSLTRH